MVWHFLTARSQAWNFWTISKCFRSVVFFGLPSLRQDVRAYDIRARLCGLRVNFFRDQLKGSVWQLGVLKCLKCLAKMYGLYGMKHNGHVTCHMCLFWYQPLKFGKHAFECMLDLHVLFVSGKAGGFRNVGTIQPSRVVRGSCTTFFTCTANVLKPPVRYYRPGEKIYGNTRGQLLHCQWKGHNACLPDCVRNGLGVGKVPE